MRSVKAVHDRRLPCRRRGRRCHRRRRGPAARRHAVGAVAFHRRRRTPAEVRPERAARRRIPACQPAGAGEEPEGARWASSSWSPRTPRRCRARTAICVATVLLDTGIVPMDGAGNPPDRSKRRPASSRSRRSAATARRSASRSATCRPSPTGSLPRSKSRASARSPSIRPSAATASCSPTPEALGFAVRPDEARELALDGHEDHRRRQPAACLPPSRPAGLEPHLVLLPDRPGRGSRRAACRAATRASSAGQDRPIADRHRLLGAHGGAARQGRI